MNEATNLMLVRAEIAGLSENEQDAVKRLATSIRALIANNPLGVLAVALVGAELAAQE